MWQAYLVGFFSLVSSLVSETKSINIWDDVVSAFSLLLILLKCENLQQFLLGKGKLKTGQVIHSACLSHSSLPSYAISSHKLCPRQLPWYVFIHLVSFSVRSKNKKVIREKSCKLAVDIVPINYIVF